MSKIEEKKSKPFEKLSAKIGYIAFLCLVVFAIWKIGNVWIERVVNRQQEQVSEAIINTVNQRAKLNLLMPRIVFINIDSIHKKQLNDSISKQIATVLIQKYTCNKNIDSSEINFQPFFVFPDSADNKGNYKLTKEQLEQLKNHIQFLTSQVDKAVTATKAEIANDIERLNTWVSVWIGIIGFLGIFIPIVINFKSSEELKEINIKAEQAETKVNEVQSYIKENKEHIENLKSIPADLIDLKKNFDVFKGEVEQAKTTSGHALAEANAANITANKHEKLVSTLNDIIKIKDIDSSFLLYNLKPLETLQTYLKEIHTNLSNCAELFDEPIIKDAFRQLALKTHLIAPYDFINPANFDLLNEFALNLSNLITQPLTQEKYNQALALLNALNTNLASE